MNGVGIVVTELLDDLLNSLVLSARESISNQLFKSANCEPGPFRGVGPQLTQGHPVCACHTACQITAVEHSDPCCHVDNRGKGGVAIIV